MPSRATPSHIDIATLLPLLSAAAFASAEEELGAPIVAGGAEGCERLRVADKM